MLLSLAIRDVVLVERLDLELGPGLCVLTGETGAGKSILLDALGLALGARADRGLVREGATQAVVSAAFQLADDRPVRTLLDQHGIEPEETLLLRRSLGRDGRSRAFINDQPVGLALLRRLGELLVEVHGQHDQQGLLDGQVQRALVDAYGKLEQLAAALKAAHGAWREADRARAELEAELARVSADIDYWRHILAELEELAPEPGEEERLAESRARLMNREKLIDAIQDAESVLTGDGSLGSRLGKAERALERVVDLAGETLGPAMAALERVRVELDEAAAAFEHAGATLTADGDRLEEVEERLFALRAASRKHKRPVDELPALHAETRSRLERVDTGDAELAAATARADAARVAFVEAARKLSAGREKAAGALARAVMTELPPLKLEKARFEVRLLPLEEKDWSEHGAERVDFQVATNPGQKPGPLAKIASGGELARLMLALKVVLAKVESTACLVFDEVDSGIGGATADAVGDRLARLGDSAQVLVVTHAPQVAARADLHLKVEKATERGRATVKVAPLRPDARREEIARMLAGAIVTEAARAAADSLIGQSA